MQPFSRLLDIKYLFCRLNVFAAVSSLIIYVSLSFVFGTFAAVLFGTFQLSRLILDKN